MEAIKERRAAVMLEKSRRVTRGLETVLIMGALALAFCLAAPRAVHAQNIQIFAANPLDFGGSGDNNEVSAACTIIGTPVVVKFYDNTVTTTAATDVMLVTISAVGDADGSNRLQVQCKVDGTACKTGNIGDDKASGPGWVAEKFSDEDQIVNYTWCVPIKKTEKNGHEVVLNLENLCDITTGAFVSLEQVNVFVEGFHAGKSKFLGPQACKTPAGVAVGGGPAT